MHTTPSKAVTYTSRGANLSANRKHRYALWRFWDEELPKLVIIGLNPSTADETDDDPTIRRCIGFAHREGLGGLLMLNLFSWRSSEPSDLHRVLHRPEMQTAMRENRRTIIRVAARHHDGCFVAAWGSNMLARGQWLKLDVRKYLPNLYCFGLTQAGSPKHPLYLAASTQLMPFNS